MTQVKNISQTMENHRFLRFISRYWLAVAVIAPSLAFAQMPEDETEKVDYPLSYRSTLLDYEAYKDQSVQPWKTANDTVGEIGGWRAYAKEMRQTAPTTGLDQPARDHDAHHGGKQ